MALPKKHLGFYQNWNGGEIETKKAIKNTKNNSKNRIKVNKILNYC
jgi:hypothetical protein